MEIISQVRVGGHRKYRNEVLNLSICRDTVYIQQKYCIVSIQYRQLNTSFQQRLCSRQLSSVSNRKRVGSRPKWSRNIIFLQLGLLFIRITRAAMCPTTRQLILLLDSAGTPRCPTAINITFPSTTKILFTTS